MPFMHKFWRHIRKNSLLVLVWFCLLSLLSFFVVAHYPVNPSFPYYNLIMHYWPHPSSAVWGYFDGTHYIRLATVGYVDIGTQAFFPLYPLIVKTLAALTSLPLYPVAVGLNLVWLIFTLTIIIYLFPRASWIVTLAVLFFPTSFFFAAIYSESLFFCLSLLFFLLLHRRHWWLAAAVASLASATRLVGALLAPTLLIAYLSVSPKPPQIRDPRYYLQAALLTFTASLGFFAYLIFLFIEYRDPLMFLHVQPMFGAERSAGEIILLPQVIYRYLKMIFTVDTHSWLCQRIWLELGFFVIAVVAWIRNFSRTSLAVNFYVGASLLLPTLTGTLSSIPRYTLVLIPFLLPPDLPKKYFYMLLGISIALLLYLFTLFTRGSFVA